MMSLLDLPREIRDHILTYVLLTPVTPPDLDQAFDSLIRGRVGFKNAKLALHHKEVLYTPEPAARLAPSLLLVNRQLHHETLSNLRLLDTDPTCDMDLIIAEEVALLPTWTRLPFQRSTAMDALNVTFRIAGAYDKKKVYPHGFDRAFSATEIGPTLVLHLYAILQQFTCAGPGRETEQTDTNLHVTAKRLRIDVQTPDGIDASRFGTPQSASGPWKRGKKPEADVVGPEWLARFLRGQLSALLGHGMRDWFHYGKLLYEHLDEVVVSLDGVEMGRWDVAECLKQRELEERYFPREKLQEYKDETWRARRDRGLKVLEN